MKHYSKSYSKRKTFTRKRGRNMTGAPGYILGRNGGKQLVSKGPDAAFFTDLIRMIFKPAMGNF